MATTDRNQQDYYERIDFVKRYIRTHLDESLDRQQLAAIAGFSVSHFHRIFTAIVGENIASYVRRVRMERAGWQLRTNVINITEIALAAGYDTPAAFGKAFKQHFAVSPSQFRQLNQCTTTHMLNEHRVFRPQASSLQPNAILTLPDRKILYARASEIKVSQAFHTAPAQAYSKLMGYLQARGLTEQVQHFVALYPDEPEIGKTVRFDAGVIFGDGIEPSATDGLAYQTLAGGRWAVFSHVGPYETLWRTWTAIYREWLPTAGIELRDVLPFEVYVNNLEQVQPEELYTEMHIPIQ